MFLFDQVIRKIYLESESYSYNFLMGCKSNRGIYIVGCLGCLSSQFLGLHALDSLFVLLKLSISLLFPVLSDHTGEVELALFALNGSHYRSFNGGKTSASLVFPNRFVLGRVGRKRCTGTKSLIERLHLIVEILCPLGVLLDCKDLV